VCTFAALILTACAQDAANDAERATNDMPTSVATADGIEVTMRASAREIEVGQPLHVEMSVLADADVRVEWPQFDKELGPFEVRSTVRVPPIPVDGKRRWQAQLELMTFDEGELELPAVEIGYEAAPANEDGTQDRGEQKLESKPLTIIARSVVGADADPSAFRDIKGAAEMPTESAWFWWVIGGGAAALLVMVLLLALLLRQRKPAVQRILAPHEWALQELDAIAKAQLIEQRAFEPFYVRLSAVVRGYLERRFGLMAPERTTDEFLHEARRSNHLRDDQRRLLSDFLRAADMVKFARFEPTDTDCREALASARSFVEQTVLREPAPDARHSAQQGAAA